MNSYGKLRAEMKTIQQQHFKAMKKKNIIITLANSGKKMMKRIVGDRVKSKMKNKLPKDFNAELYLNLHPDVKAAGIDAAKHFLEYGVDEGRKYKSSKDSSIKKKPPTLSDISQLHNDGIFILGDNESPTSRTIIIVGLPRSGTSMPAKALHDLGVWMGDGIDSAVFEDVRLAEALEKKIKDLPGVIEDYNNRFDTWGFKRPSAFKLLPKHINKFRNPRILVMFRDPLAIAKRNSISVEIPFHTALQDSTKQISKLVNFSINIDAPKMLVSYEKAILSPEKFIKALVQFVGCKPTPEDLNNAISNIQNSPEGYLIASQTKFSV